MNFKNILKKTLYVFAALVVSNYSFAGGFKRAKPAPAPNPRAPDSGGNVSLEDKQWHKIIKNNDGRIADPKRYSNNKGGFDRFLDDSGVRRYSAASLITPNSSSSARQCGYTNLLPPQNMWVRGAALALWAETLADVANDLPRIRNWYRPRCYNSKVGGAAQSDHIQARSVDLDFDSSRNRRKAQLSLCRTYNSSINMQVGLGRVTIHLGAQSPNGKRNWFYGSYKDSDKNRTCFD